MAKSKLFLLFGLVAALVLSASPVSAQSIGVQGGTSSQNYGASNQSDFQSAGFQQSGSSAATTAAGSGEILKQVGGQAITVSGAPANQPQSDTPKSNTPLYLWLILACSGLGLLMLYFYQRQTKQSHDTSEVNEIAEVFDEPKPKSEKPKKSKKKSTKKKKTHR